MRQYLFVGKPKNNIACLGKIPILSLVAILSFWPIVPVKAVALDHDGVIIKQKVNHKFIKHDHLFSEGNTTTFQELRHFIFKIGTLSRRQAIKNAEYPMLLTAIFAFVLAAWLYIKFDTAIVASNFDFWFPRWAIFAFVLLAYCYTRAFLRTVFLFAKKGSAQLENYSALLAGCVNFYRALTLCPLRSVSGVSAFGGAKFCYMGAMISGKKHFPTFDTFLWNERGFLTSEAAKSVLDSFAVAFLHFDIFATNCARKNVHKKASYSLLTGCMSKAYGKRIRGKVNNNRLLASGQQIYAFDKCNYSTVQV